MDNYLHSLTADDYAQVVKHAGHKVFRFGGGETLRSKATYSIPATLAGKNVCIQTDVVESDIPLLLSKDAMKKARVKLDLENDAAEIFGKAVPLDMTSSGHYCVPIRRNADIAMEMVCAVNLQTLNEEDRIKTLNKLHRQFAHPHESKLRALLQDAGAWKDSFQETLSRVYEQCNLCKQYKTTPPRPVVSMPMATKFNEKVAMDLKKWDDNWILHLVDMWSRFSVSCFVARKRPRDIIDKMMTCWVSVFGVMEAVLTDNGGEFSAEEMREVASLLNVKVCTTAAYSPFQNGLCERNHAVTDNMLLIMKEQHPEINLDVLLCWANMAKNSLHSYHGFSSYQLVFGKNPNLPNIMCENLPALDGVTTSMVSMVNLMCFMRTCQILSGRVEKLPVICSHRRARLLLENLLPL